ncbi:MAG: hypothetical protein PHU85_11200 [Phycisphaerae bacterium]|nr:hypothetical protein [Phycisphaerae bacterium]
MRSVLLGLGVSVSALTAAAVAADITELTVAEQVGAARSNGQETPTLAATGRTARSRRRRFRSAGRGR